MKTPACFSCFVLTALALASPPLWAVGDERQQLAQQRAEIEARHKAALVDCATRFNVNSCQDEARQRRGAALKPVQARELALDAEERQARAARQRERVKQKQEGFVEQESRQQSKALLAPEPALVPGPTGKPARVTDESAHARAVQAEIEKGEQDAAQRRAAAEQREQRAQAHREASQRRQQARAASAPANGAKPIVQLPLPTAAELAALPSSGASRSGR